MRLLAFQREDELIQCMSEGRYSKGYLPGYYHCKDIDYVAVDCSCTPIYLFASIYGVPVSLLALTKRYVQVSKRLKYFSDFVITEFEIPTSAIVSMKDMETVTEKDGKIITSDYERYLWDIDTLQMDGYSYECIVKEVKLEWLVAYRTVKLFSDMIQMDTVVYNHTLCPLFEKQVLFEDGYYFSDRQKSVVTRDANDWLPDVCYKDIPANARHLFLKN